MDKSRETADGTPETSAVLNARDSHPGVPADPWPGLSESDLQQFAEIVA